MSDTMSRASPAGQEHKESSKLPALAHQPAQNCCLLHHFLRKSLFYSKTIKKKNILSDQTQHKCLTTACIMNTLLPQP